MIIKKLLVSCCGGRGEEGEGKKQFYFFGIILLWTLELWTLETHPLFFLFFFFFFLFFFFFFFSGLIEQMRDRNIILSPYLDQTMTDTIFKEVGESVENNRGGKDSKGSESGSGGGGSGGGSGGSGVGSGGGGGGGGDGEIGEEIPDEIGGEIGSDFSGSGSDDELYGSSNKK